MASLLHFPVVVVVRAHSIQNTQHKIKSATMTNTSDPLTDYRNTLKALDVKRKTLELEADTITSELTAVSLDGSPPMGIDTPLVDMDGYPRGDIDVYRARSLRGQLAVIQTDHKALMKQMEKCLEAMASLNSPEEEALRRAPKPKPKFDPITGKWVVKNWDGTVAGIAGGDQRSFDTLAEATHHEEQAALNATAAAAVTATEAATVVAPPTTENQLPKLVPFARIDAVASHSPSAFAGLEEGDLVVKFGAIDYDHPHPLPAIAELVPATVERQESLTVVVLRNEESHKLTLTPQPWDGQGMLGCFIVPYTN